MLRDVDGVCMGMLRTATGWSPELDLGSREPLDDLHRSAALGAGPEGGSGLGLGGVWNAIRCGRAKRAEANRQQGGAQPGGQKAKVPDAHKTLG